MIILMHVVGIEAEEKAAVNVNNERESTIDNQITQLVSESEIKRKNYRIESIAAFSCITI